METGSAVVAIIAERIRTATIVMSPGIVLTVVIVWTMKTTSVKTVGNAWRTAATVTIAVIIVVKRAMDSVMGAANAASNAQRMKSVKSVRSIVESARETEIFAITVRYAMAV